MTIRVEPTAGSELDRLISALFNVTGGVHQTMQTSDAPAHLGGEAFIDHVAKRLREPLAVLAELRSDADLELVTQLLAQTTLLVAADLGLDPGLYADH